MATERKDSYIRRPRRVIRSGVHDAITNVRYVATTHDEGLRETHVTQVRVLLEVLVEEAHERELGPMDESIVPAAVAAYANDELVNLTRKEFNEPWRVIDVRLAI